MGLVETAAENLSLRSVAVVTAVGYGLYTIASRLVEETKLRKLAAVPHGQQMASIAPFGLDFIARSIYTTMHYRNLEFWDYIFSRVRGWTGETRLLGLRIVFTADPENIKAILATQFSDYGKGEPFHEEWHEFLGDGIFTTDGPRWHASRQLIRPQFVRDRVSDLDCFEEHFQVLLRAMYNGGAIEGADQFVDMTPGAMDGKVFDISDLFFRYTLDVATDFLLGQGVGSLTTPRQDFAEAFNHVQRIQGVISRSAKLRWAVPKSSFRAGMRIVDDFVNRYIDMTLRLSPEELATKTKLDKGYTFLHALAGFTRDRKVLRDQLVSVLLAARDTTASTLSWTLFELGRHPEAVAQLRAEILATVGPDRTPTYEDLKNMKYLQNTMHETLRLYPSVPFNVRMALKDTTLPRGGGPDGSQPLAVLKDTPIGYSTLVMQRRTDLYPPASVDFPDPLVFAPDRWRVWQPRPWEFVPFNGGPRICIGQQFALTEMGYVLVRLFQRFERVESYGEVPLKADIVLQPAEGVSVAFWEAKAQ